MKSIIFLLGGLGIGSAAVVTTVATVQPTAVVQSFGIDSHDERPGPDSALVSSVLGAMATTHPAVCEMLADQVGNFWFSSGDFGIGMMADTRMAARASRDSMSGRVHDIGAIKLLVGRLADNDPCIRRTAARLLGRSAVPDDNLAGLLGDGSARVREAALMTVGTRESIALRNRVEQMLNDGDASVVAMAAWALGELEQRESVGPLVNAASHQSSQVRTTVAWALGRIEDPKATAPLRKLLRDVNAGVRAISAEALGDIEARDAVGDLEQIVSNDSDSRVRFYAIEALGSLEMARSAGVLARVVAGGDVTLQIVALEALGDLDDLHRAPDEVVRATRSGNADVRLAAVGALARISDPATSKTLLAAIEDPNPEVRVMVIEALGEMEAVDATDAITLALADSNAEVRRAAVEALADIEDR